MVRFERLNASSSRWSQPGLAAPAWVQETKGRFGKMRKASETTAALTPGPSPRPHTRTPRPEPEPPHDPHRPRLQRACPSAMAGIGIRYFELARRLAERGIDVRLVSPASREIEDVLARNGAGWAWRCGVSSAAGWPRSSAAVTPRGPGPARNDVVLEAARLPVRDRLYDPWLIENLSYRRHPRARSVTGTITHLLGPADVARRLFCARRTSRGISTSVSSPRWPGQSERLNVTRTWRR